MADQGKWWKLWCASLRDDDLENLTVHEWFCWARFGAHIKENGKDGKIRLRKPATAIVNLFRVDTFDAAINIIKTFPNYTLDVTPDAEFTFSVKCKNWNKYQGDWSRDRVRKMRKAVTANVTIQEEKRREEKRSLTSSPLPPAGGSKIRDWFEKTWKAYPKERRVGKKAALRSYQALVKTLDDAIWLGRGLDTYLKSKTVQDGFLKNASTFFANAEDYCDERRDSPGTVVQVAEPGAAGRLPGSGEAAPNGEVVAHTGDSESSENPRDRLHR